MNISPDIPLAGLNRAINEGPEHYRPIFLAMRDWGCAFMFVPQSKEPFDPPTDKPIIGIIGDDYDAAFGPGRFHQRSLRAFVQRCDVAVVVSAGITLPPYALAATTAAGLRRNAILVETRIEQEIPWVNFLRQYRPDIRMVISTVQGGTG